MTAQESTPNYSRRFTLDNLDIRGQVVRLESVWQSMHTGREYPDHIRTFLGELACVSVLVGAGLKHAGRAVLQIQPKRDVVTGQSGAPLAVVDCTETLAVRGMALRAKNAEAHSFADWVQGGTLALSLTHTNTNQIYQSIVPLSGLSVAECFEHYFDQSEQLPTHLWLAAGATGAGALLLQKLPNADRKDPDGWARMELLAASITSLELTKLDSATMLTRLFSEEDIRLYDAKPVSYGCKHDPAKVEAMLHSLGREEVEATLAEQGEIVVTDDICNETYRFGRADIDRLFSQ